jgi:hypothetical protein
MPTKNRTTTPISARFKAIRAASGGNFGSFCHNLPGDADSDPLLRAQYFLVYIQFNPFRNLASFRKIVGARAAPRRDRVVSAPEGRRERA